MDRAMSRALDKAQDEGRSRCAYSLETLGRKFSFSADLRTMTQRNVRSGTTGAIRNETGGLFGTARLDRLDFASMVVSVARQATGRPSQKEASSERLELIHGHDSLWYQTESKDSLMLSFVPTQSGTSCARSVTILDDSSSTSTHSIITRAKITT